MCPFQIANAWLLALSPVAAHADMGLTTHSSLLPSPIGADLKQLYIACIACPLMQATSKHNNSNFPFQCGTQDFETVTHVRLSTGVKMSCCIHML